MFIRFILEILVVVPAVSLPARSAAVNAVPTIVELRRAIQEVKKGDQTMKGFHAGDKFLDICDKIPADEIDDKTLAETMSLLDSPRESVKTWGVRCLGRLGPRARAAIPKLKEMLPKADCIPGTITSAAYIRAVLEKLGEAVPPPVERPCGRKTDASVEGLQGGTYWVK
jgi:hypothetical protein